VSLVGFRGRNHPQQVGRNGARAEVDDRATPPEVFAPLNERFGFTIDVAASSHNTKCDRYFDVETDGLAQSWAGERVWCNPPYSDIGAWVQKAWDSWPAAELIVMLLPANRTEQRW
jgi:phage N-6-adenine-methyltransferase